MTRAEAIAALLTLRRRGQRKDVDFAGHLFSEQRSYFDDRSRVKVLRTGRRAGKSTAVAARLLHRVHGRPGHNAIYLTLTRRNAKRILWPAALSVLQRHQIPHRLNLTDLEIQLSGGGTLLIGGVDTQDQIERYRGLAYADAAIDECQSFPSERLRSLAQDVLRPALIDHAGDLTFAGTPGPVPAGYWYGISGPESLHLVHHWTLLRNPHIRDAVAELARIREENGWTEDSATYVREYLGQWVVDLAALVYPFDETRNWALALPLHTRHGVIADPSLWRYVLSVDVGEIHATSFVVAAAHPALSEDFVVHAEKMLDMQTDRMAARIRDLRTLYTGPVVMDTQGIGKKHADEVRTRFGIPVEAADKADKASGIRIVRDRLQSGQLKLLPEAASLRSEWATIVWNKARNDHERDQEDHCADACIYAIRKLRNYTSDHMVPEPKHGTPEWYRREAERMFEARRKQIRKANRAAGWDR